MVKTFGNDDYITIDDVFKETDKYIKKPENKALIMKAYDYASKKHANQMRKSGNPYVFHLLHVALTLADLRVDPNTIAAGLLHDTIEDCEVCDEEFINLFGEDIYNLVEAVTKVNKLKFNDDSEYLASNHRKIFVAMAKDVRVIMIKLADRLHNMRTLQFMSEAKQKKIAQETLDVYAPIAHRLGISELKNELEDLSFRYLDYDKYKEIANLVERKKVERDQDVEDMIEKIRTELDEHNIKYDIKGRSKHLYSIYKKMYYKHKRFDEIFDLSAIRIIAKTELSCYEILGYIHARFRPVPGRFKDYIAMPKSNMYQSLHTTIVGPNGNIFEIQIRTQEMDDVAERGVAAHWRYKENQYHKEQQQKEIEEKLTWYKDFAQMSYDEDADSKTVMNIISNDIFEANVYVLTPKGKVIPLPQGSTPIDFAYRIHTDIGNTTIGAKVNNTLVPLNTVLKNGDVVNILTNKNAHPSEDWLKLVKSAHAKQKIRNYFIKREQSEKKELIDKAKLALNKALLEKEYDPNTFATKKKLEAAARNLKFPNDQELLYGLANHRVSLTQVVEEVTDTKQSKKLKDNALKALLNKVSKKKKQHNHLKRVTIGGLNGMKYSLSKCCCPIYGDDIVGYITKGDGVKIHRKDCPNIKKQQDRLIDAVWDEPLKDTLYNVNLEIISENRDFLLSDIVIVCSQAKVNMDQVKSIVSSDKMTVTTSLSVEVKSLEQLNTLIANLNKVTNVLKVNRVIM